MFVYGDVPVSCDGRSAGDVSGIAVAFPVSVPPSATGWSVDRLVEMDDMLHSTWPGRKVGSVWIDEALISTVMILFGAIYH